MLPKGLAAVCAACPVRRECARDALEAHAAGLLLVGVWAGVLVSVTGVGRREAWRELAELARG